MSHSYFYYGIPSNSPCSLWSERQLLDSDLTHKPQHYQGVCRIAKIKSNMVHEYVNRVALFLKEGWIFILPQRQVSEHFFCDTKAQNGKEILKDKSTPLYLENPGVFFFFFLFKSLLPSFPQGFQGKSKRLYYELKYRGMGENKYKERITIRAAS